MTEISLKLRPLSPDSAVGRWTLDKAIYVLPHAIVYQARATSDDGASGDVLIEEFFPASLVGRAAEGSRVQAQAGKSQAFALHRSGYQDFIERLRRLPLGKTLTVLDLVSANDTHYAVFGVPSGPRLEQLLRPEECLEPSEIDDLLPPLLAALDAIHDVGMAHHGLSPDAVFITADGSIVLDRPAPFAPDTPDDLGYAWQEDDPYRPPEYAADRTKTDNARPGTPTGVAADLYGLSTILFRGVTGRPPPMQATATAGGTDPVAEALANVPDAWAQPLLRAIKRGMASDPADRPSSVAAYRAILRAESPLSEPDVDDVGRRSDPESDPDQVSTQLIARPTAVDESGMESPPDPHDSADPDADPDMVATKLVRRSSESARTSASDAETDLDGPDQNQHDQDHIATKVFRRPENGDPTSVMADPDQVTTQRLDRLVSAVSDETPGDRATPDAADSTDGKVAEGQIIYRAGKAVTASPQSPIDRARAPAGDAVSPQYFLSSAAAGGEDDWRDLDFFIAEPGIKSVLSRMLESGAGGSGTVREAPLLTIRPGAPVTVIAATDRGTISPAVTMLDWRESVQRVRLRLSPGPAQTMTKGGESPALNLRFTIMVGPVTVAVLTSALPDAASPVPLDGALEAPFLSLDWADQAVRTAIEAVQTHLCLPFLDQQFSARRAGDWSPDMLRLIEQADLFQLCWTSPASISRSVRQELDFAEALVPAKPLLPIMMDAIAPALPVFATTILPALHFGRPGFLMPHARP